MNFDLWSLLLAIGAFQGILLIVYILRTSLQNKSSYYLSALVFVIVLNLVDYLILASHAYRMYPQLITFSNATIFLIGPFYYKYMQSQIDKNGSLMWLDLLHLIPFLFAIFYHMDVYLLSVDQKIRFVENYLFVDHYSTSMLAVVYISVHTLQNLLYAFFTHRSLNQKPSSWLRHINFGFMTYWLILYAFLMLLAALNRLTFEDDYIIVLINAVLLNLLVYASIGDRNILKKLLNGQQLKYARSALSDETIEAYMNKLNQLMIDEKPYLNPNLKLNQLAEQMGISNNHLSQLLNDRIQMSFNDYLNSKRIESVKQLMMKNESSHLNLYGIALDCGFNSKNTFNRAFKKATGITPSHYRKTESASK